MKFQKKIVWVYALFSAAIIVILASVYYFMSVRQYKDNEYSNIKTVSNVKLQQMDTMLQGMEAAITYFLSDTDVLESLQTIAKLDTESYEELFFDQSVRTIRERLLSYYLMEEYERAVVFNKKGHVISNMSYKENGRETNVYKDYPFLNEVCGKRGKSVILGFHSDNWNPENKEPVISVVKEIQGMDMGIVEIQQSKIRLDKVFGSGGETEYIFLTADNSLLYAKDENIDVSYCLKQMDDAKEAINTVQLGNGQTALCMKTESPDRKITLLTIIKTDIEKRAITAVLPVSFILFFGALVLASGYVYLTSKRLTRPIRQLQEFMETTDLDNLDAEMPQKLSNDEIESLYAAYRKVLERLQGSIIKERRLSLMQLQAQFDLLQSQVNPHFIYNVLNVISNRGMISDDEVICDMCSELAAMLRYATNTREKYARVCDEAEYLNHYLSLLKYRYHYRLSYKIEIQEEILQEIMPKIVLQQLVENAVVHGYGKSEETMEIEVYGYRDKTGWYLKVHDNGCGITLEKAEQIRASMQDIRRKLTDSREHVEMEIGGMGLVNTYARLYLMYNEKLIFEVVSGEHKGTDVVIGVLGEVGNDV